MPFKHEVAGPDDSSRASNISRGRLSAFGFSRLKRLDVQSTYAIYFNSFGVLDSRFKNSLRLMMQGEVAFSNVLISIW